MTNYKAEENFANDRLSPERLNFQDGSVPSPQKDSAFDDLQYATNELSGYLNSVSRGELEYNGDTVNQMRDAVEDAQARWEQGEVTETQSAGDYFRSEEGQRISGMIGKAGVKVLEKTTGLSDPTGAVSEAAESFAKTAVPMAADAGEKLMERAHDTYENKTLQEYRQTYFMKDSEGNPITAEEARALAFGEADESDLEQTNKQDRFFDQAQEDDTAAPEKASETSSDKQSEFFEDSQEGASSNDQTDAASKDLADRQTRFFEENNESDPPSQAQEEQSEPTQPSQQTHTYGMV